MAKYPAKPEPKAAFNGSLSQKKALSQVFLKVDWPVEQMASLLRSTQAERVLEIGPGAGVLTKALLKEGFAVTAVERDERFAAFLHEHLVAGHPYSGSLTVVQADILRFDLDSWLKEGSSPAAIVGNIPYHISSLIVQQTIPWLSQLEMVLLMTQLEFAARVAASPSSKAYGSLSVYAQLHAQTKLEFKVGKECFKPVPKVDSAVMSMKRLENPWPEELLLNVEKVTKQAFSQRRKKLSNSLLPLISGGSFEGCPVDLNLRADALTPEDYIEIAKWLG